MFKDAVLQETIAECVSKVITKLNNFTGSSWPKAWHISRLRLAVGVSPFVLVLGMAYRSLVTGATGFVGSAVARALLARGHQVRVLARPGSDRRNLFGLNVEIAEGRLEDAASLERAVAGCDAVFHVAADYRLWVPDPEAMLRANVTGTQALMRAAGLTLPLTLEIALKARERGWLPADAPLPSSRAQLLDWLGRVQL